MIIDLWLTGKRCDMYSDSNIRFTFQANDIAEIKDRQASFTNQFKIPKTDWNVQIMQGLGIPSDGSRVPYLKSDCMLKIDGFDFISKGWANITEADEDYNIYVYSGIINFFKSIEGKTIGRDLPEAMEEIDHVKNIQSVLGSFTSDKLRYLIADYGGEFLDADGNVNIDYLMPSINAFWLWSKIFEKTGFTWSGNALWDLKKRWVSYPKAKNLADNYEEYLNGNIHRIESAVYGPLFQRIEKDHKYIQITDEDITNGTLEIYGENFMPPFFPSKGHYRVPETGWYHLSLEGTIKWVSSSLFKALYAEIFLCKNAVGKRPKSAIDSGGESLFRINEFLNFQKDYSKISVKKAIFLNSGETLSIAIKDMGYVPTLESNLNIVISRINQEEISFSKELNDFSIKDFIKECLSLYGLTPFTSETSNEIQFLTVADRLKLPPKDWTSKYVSRTSEKYIYNDYAQRNIFKYKYTEKDAQYNDAAIVINNEILPEQKIVYESKFYSPEQITKKYVIDGRMADIVVFKMWERSDKKGEVSYQSKDNRFYLISENWVDSTVRFKSGITGESGSAYHVPFGNFRGGRLQDFIDNYYPQLRNLIQDSRIHEIELDLDTADIVNMDLRAPVYFSQEQQYYLINKTNFDENKASGEFIRIIEFLQANYTDEKVNNIAVSYNSDVWDSVGWDYTFANSDLTLNYDNIRVLTLPDKGVLFKALHYGEFTPVAENELIDAYAINEEALFKFKAEGRENNQFVGNYVTEFKIQGVNDNGTEGPEIIIQITASDSGSGKDSGSGGTVVTLRQYCFVGVFSETDSIHNYTGGRVVYIDQNGEQATETGIFSEMGIVSIMAKEIISTTGVNRAECQ